VTLIIQNTAIQRQSIGNTLALITVIIGGAQVTIITSSTIGNRYRPASASLRITLAFVAGIMEAGAIHDDRITKANTALTGIVFSAGIGVVAGVVLVDGNGHTGSRRWIALSTGAGGGIH